MSEDELAWYRSQAVTANNAAAVPPGCELDEAEDEALGVTDLAEDALVEEDTDFVQEDPEERRQRLLEEATQELELAMLGKDILMLESMLKQAVDIGVDSGVVERARAVKVDLLLASRDEAMYELEEAICSEDLARLTVAIDHAMIAGVSVEAVELARKRKAAMEEELQLGQTRKVLLQRLESATRGDDLAMLGRAIEWAVKVGITGPVLDCAEARKAELEEASRQQSARREVTRALETAVAGSDLKALNAALSRAVEAGVPAEALDRARLRRAMLDGPETERRKAWERSEAASALDYTTIGTDVEALDSAIEWAVACGVDEEVLEPARKRRAALLEAEQRRKEIEEMSTLLELAISSADIMLLKSAIARVEGTGLLPALVARAKEQADLLVSQANDERAHHDTLAALEAAEDLDALRLALGMANLVGLTGSAVEAAQARLAMLEADEDQLNVLQELEVLVHGSDAAAITDALQRAAELGIQAPALQAAQRRQAELLSEELERAREEVQAELQVVMRGADVNALASAISRAISAGVDEQHLNLARTRLATLEEQRRRRAVEGAERALERAIQSASLEALARVISWARQVGATGDMLERANQRRIELEQESQVEFARAEANAALENLAESNNPHELAQAITKALKLGISSEALKRARLRYQAIRADTKTRQAASRALNAAVLSSDPAELESALDWAEQVGVSPVLLARGRRRQAALEALAQQGAEAAEAPESLPAANPEALEHGDRSAVEAGVDSARWKPAAVRWGVKVKQHQPLAAAALEHAIKRATDAASLQAVMNRASAAGVDPHLLERAAEQRQVLEKREHVREQAEQALQTAMHLQDPSVLSAIIRWTSKVLGTDADAVRRAEQRRAELEAAAATGTPEGPWATTATRTGTSKPSTSYSVAVAPGHQADQPRPSRRWQDQPQAAPPWREPPATGATAVKVEPPGLDDTTAAKDWGSAQCVPTEKPHMGERIRSEALKLLKTAARGRDPETLELAIETAARAGISSSLVAQARERKAALEAELSRAIPRQPALRKVSRLKPLPSSAVKSARTGSVLEAVSVLRRQLARGDGEERGPRYSPQAAPVSSEVEEQPVLDGSVQEPLQAAPPPSLRAVRGRYEEPAVQLNAQEEHAKRRRVTAPASMPSAAWPHWIPEPPPRPQRQQAEEGAATGVHPLPAGLPGLLAPKLEH